MENNVQTAKSKQELLSYMYLGNLQDNIDKLESIVGGYWRTPSTHGNYVLRNYLMFMFNRLSEEGKILESDTYSVFNTGLFNEYYEQIYCYCELNGDGLGSMRWRFIGFYTEYELIRAGVREIPDRADFFKDPSLLIYNWNYKINVQYNHILADAANKERLPESIKKMGSVMQTQMLRGAIEVAINKVMADYRIAIPQYFAKGIQLLIPIELEEEGKVNLVLMVTRDDAAKCYQGHTCITPDMAYMNARLINKLDGTWLDPKNLGWA